MWQQKVRVKDSAIRAAGDPLCVGQAGGEAERSGSVDEACGLGAGVLQKRPLLAVTLLGVKKKVNLTIFGAAAEDEAMRIRVVAPEMVVGDNVVEALAAEEENHQED